MLEVKWALLLMGGVDLGIPGLNRRSSPSTMRMSWKKKRSMKRGRSPAGMRGR